MYKNINFLKLIVQFSAPLSSVALMIFGSAFYTTFVSIFLDSQGYTKDKIGYIQSAYFLGMLLGAFQMEKIIKRVGHIQSLAVFGSLATCSTILQGLFQVFPAWVFLRFLVGLSLAALYIVIESWMLNQSKLKTRGVILSIYMMCLYSAQSASQQLLSVIDIQSYTPFLVSALFTSLSVIPVGLSTSRITLPPIHEPIHFRRILITSPFGFAGCLVSGLILSSLYSFLPLFASSREIPSENMMSILIAGGVILQWPIGKLSDYFERRKTLLCVVLITICFVISGFVYKGTSSITILSLAFIIGGLAFTLYPLSITQVCDHLDHSQITTATALLLIVYGSGSVLGPIVSSAVIDQTGIDGIFLYISALLFLLACVGGYTTLRRPIIPLPEQNDFVPLTNVTPVAYEMDPRGES